MVMHHTPLPLINATIISLPAIGGIIMILFYLVFISFELPAKGERLDMSKMTCQTAHLTLSVAIPWQAWILHTQERPPDFHPTAFPAE